MTYIKTQFGKITQSQHDILACWIPSGKYDAFVYERPASRKEIFKRLGIKTDLRLGFCSLTEWQEFCQKQRDITCLVARGFLICQNRKGYHPSLTGWHYISDYLKGRLDLSEHIESMRRAGMMAPIKGHQVKALFLDELGS